MISWDDYAIGMRQLTEPLIEVDERLCAPAGHGEVPSVNQNVAWWASTSLCHSCVSEIRMIVTLSAVCLAADGFILMLNCHLQNLAGYPRSQNRDLGPRYRQLPQYVPLLPFATRVHSSFL
jgi:hypothetical protein